jgi:HlyD family secretion protein
MTALMTVLLPLARLAVLIATLALVACNGARDQTLQGWVEADLIFVAPDEAGRVETLAVREGDTVAAGAPLFTVEADLQEADVRASAAAVEEARARLARLEAAQQRKEEVAVLRAQEKRAESALRLSTIELQRQNTLAEKAIASKAALDTAQANNDRDRATLEEVRRQIQVAEMNSREEDIAAAKQSIAGAEARLRSSQTRLARRHLASPVAATVQQIYFRPGEMVPAGRPVIALLPPQNVKIRFFVPEPMLPRIAYRDTVKVRCDGCADDLSARVSFISRTAEYTPPVIYSLDERAKLVFMIEARPAHPDRFRVGQPLEVTLVPHLEASQ